MTKSITDAIKQTQILAAAITGIKAAPENMPESILVKPFTVCYAEGGEFYPETASDGTSVPVFERHDIILEAHYDRSDFINAQSATKAAIPLFIAKLSLNPTLNGAVDTIIYPILYGYGQLQFNSDTNIGFRLTIPIKIRKVYT